MRIILCFFFLLSMMQGDCIAGEQCGATLLLDGSQEFITADIDSTGHWWAITRPFSNRYKVWVDGKSARDYDSVQIPVFAPDGSDWAFFGYRNGVWYISTRDSEYILRAARPVIAFFARGGRLAWIQKVGEAEFLMLAPFLGMPEKEIQLINRSGNCYISNDGMHYAYIGARGSQQSLITDQMESARYERIQCAGFMYDNSIVYAGFTGDRWYTMRNDQELLVSLALNDLQINQACTVLSFIAGQGNSASIVMISDDFAQPYKGPAYERVENLVLHPEAALAAYKVYVAGLPRIVLNRSEYDAGLACGMHRFTHDGAELYFIGDDRQEQFMNINGKKYIQKNALNLQRVYAVHPKSGTFAFATNSALVMQRLHDGFSWAGIMVDQASNPVFNWHTARYECLGRVNNRLYLMHCTVP
jgi:hypothetical protein